MVCEKVVWFFVIFILSNGLDRSFDRGCSMARALQLARDLAILGRQVSDAANAELHDQITLPHHVFFVEPNMDQLIATISRKNITRILHAYSFVRVRCAQTCAFPDFK